MGQLMEIIQEVTRGQEIMVKMQEEMNQHAHAVNPPSNPFVVENPVPPQGNPLLHIRSRWCPSSYS